MQVSIYVLGRFDVSIDGAPIPAKAWQRDRAAALVKLLALSSAHRLHREQVMAAFWPDLDNEAAGANLRKAIHFARKSLGVHALIEVSKDVIALAPHDTLAVDVERFEAAARAALRTRDRDGYEKAADLYGGQLLPDDLFAEWLDNPRRRLQQTYVELLRAGAFWQRLIAHDPTDEQAQCALMQAALDAGNRVEAIRQFNQLRDSLSAEIGVGPSAAALALHDKALALAGADPVSATDRIRASLAWGLVHLQSGEFEKASVIARQTRDLALAENLAREVGEASALLGLAAMRQNKWRELFRSEFIEWVRARPAVAHQVFDGHLCLSEFCLCSADGHAQVAESARELREVAEAAQSSAGMGLAAILLGEVALYSGHLEEAETWLTEAEQLLQKAGAVAGRVLATERLAEIALERGQNWRAERLIRRGFADAAGSWLAPHLTMRMHALAMKAATTPKRIAEEVLAGDRTMSMTTCLPCSMGYRTASVIALAEAGELEDLDRRLSEAERIAGMWHGGPWAAALWEARGVQRRAQNKEVRALAAFDEAASRYEELGRPRDRARCLARMGDKD